MPTKPEVKQLTPAVLNALQEASLRVQTPVTAERLWDRVLSDDDKHQLGGDLEACYREFGTVGMWAEVRHVSAERAVIEVAQQTNLLDEPTAQWLLREIGDIPPQPGRPFWDASTGELKLDGKVIRKVRVMEKPSNIQQILDKFQVELWPARIGNPMIPRPPLTFDESQIRDAVYMLNKDLKKICCHAQEGGRAVTWERT